MKNRFGFSLTELVFALALGGVFLAFVIYLINNTQTKDKQGELQIQQRAKLIDIVREVQEIGRVSRSCQRTLVGVEPALVCAVDFSRPPAGVLTYVRFVRVDGALQQQRSGNLSFTSPNIIQSYSGISAFTVCGTTEMSSGSCPLLPANFNTRYQALGINNRFFRFSISAEYPLADKTSATRTQQGAFFIRTPNSPAGIAPTLGGFYRW